jgi:hypothetical protein
MRGAVHMQITTIGLDIAKNVFQIHGIDASEKVVVPLAVREQTQGPAPIRPPRRSSVILCPIPRPAPEVTEPIRRRYSPRRQKGGLMLDSQGAFH